jgi:RNA polymerase sigma-70 factor (ECF subfamily)
VKGEQAPARSRGGTPAPLPADVPPAIADAPLAALGAADAGVDDPTLVAGLVARDPRAATLLWRRFAPMVFRMLRRMLGPGSDIEDLAQEVFLCVFQKVPRLRDPQALKAFVASVTVLSVRHELRRRYIRRRALPFLRPGPPETETMTRGADAREALLRFYRILNGLTPRTRSALVLRFIEAMDLTEVAAALGVSLATTKRLLARGWTKVALQTERDPFLAQYRSGHA